VKGRREGEDEISIMPVPFLKSIMRRTRGRVGGGDEGSIGNEMNMYFLGKQHREK
jgi:hypothetical protein